MLLRSFKGFVFYLIRKFSSHDNYNSSYSAYYCSHLRYAAYLDLLFIMQMGFQFAAKVVYSAIWIAAFSLFMKLLGFSTQKRVTVGGLRTVLLTLADREVLLAYLFIY